jgi:hypothetical protein
MSEFPASTRLEPLGREQFGPELTAEGLGAERLVDKSCWGETEIPFKRSHREAHLSGMAPSFLIPTVKALEGSPAR